MSKEAMEKQCRYMIKWDRITPVLLRLEPSEKEKAYVMVSMEASRYLGWSYQPELDDILDHPERYPEYTEITKEEAEEIEWQLQVKKEEKEKKLNAVCVKHSQKQTEDGPAEVLTFRKASRWRYFSTNDYVDLLWGYLAGEKMALQGIDYSWYDEWGYQKKRSIKDIKDIRQIINDGADEIEARFSDDENKYVLRAPFLLHSIELETVRKKSGGGNYD